MIAEPVSGRLHSNRGLRVWHVARTRAGKNRLLLSGVLVLVIMIAVGIIVPVVFGSATVTNAADASLPPSGAHLFGTDRYGRDLFLRCVAGIRIDLLLGLLVAGGAFVFGSVIGAIAGMIGRYVDELLMRLTDIIMAFPAFVLALVITASLGNSTTHAVIGVGVAYTPYFVRLTRSRALSVRGLDFVSAAKLAGAGQLRAALTHVLPNSMQPALAQATLVAAWAILDIAGLSFLGVGVQPPTPEWGAMIAAGYGQILTGQWWTALFPGLFILFAATAFHLIGDALDERTS